MKQNDQGCCLTSNAYEVAMHNRIHDLVIHLAVQCSVYSVRGAYFFPRTNGGQFLEKCINFLKNLLLKDNKFLKIRIS